MRPYAKPGIDWVAIQTAWENGESPVELAKQWPVTRQAISNRRDREGWSRDMPEAAKAWLPSTIELADFGRRTPENLAEILGLIQAGTPKSIACHHIGMSPEVLRNWEADDPRVTAIIRRAEIGRAAARVERIERNPDWRAAAYLLEKDPVSKPIYGPSSSAGGLQLSVTINIPDPGTRIEGPILDVTPEPGE